MTNTLNKIITGTIIVMIVLVMAVSVVYNENIPYIFSSEQPSEKLTFYPESEKTPVEFPYTAKGEDKLRIKCKLPEVSDHMVLQVVCNFNSLSTYVDGKPVDRWNPARIANIETDIGNYRAFIELNEDYSGKELMLEIEPRDSLYTVSVKDVSLNSMAGHLTNHVKENLLTLIIGVILVLFGIVLLLIRIFYGFFGNKAIVNRAGGFVYIAVFSFATGVWMISYLHLVGIIGSRTVLSGAVNYISFMVMPYFALGIICTLTGGPKIFFTKLHRLSGFAVICQMILFLFGACDLSDTLIISHVMCILAIGAVVIRFVKACISGTLVMKTKSLIPSACITIFIVIAMLMYILDKEWMLWFCGAICIFIVMLFIETFKGVLRLTKEKIVAEEFKRHAITDALTGIGSRYSYEAEMINLKENPIPEDLTIAVIDVNRLKVTNDTLGHAAGDEVIMGVADCIVAAFKDIGTYHRTGGDEYVVFVRADEDTTKKAFDKFKKHVGAWRGYLAEILEVAFGSASVREYRDYTLDELVKSADNKMYENKRKYYKEIGHER